MLYLIGGPPKCGKTTLAKKMSQKFQIPWLSTDAIEGIVLTNTASWKRNKLFPKNLIRKKTKQSNDIMYEKYSAKEISDAYIKQAKASWNGISALTEFEVNNENNYILEGHQLHPLLIDSLIKKFGIDNFRIIFLYKKDVEKFVKDVSKSTTPNDWILAKTKEKQTLHKIAEMITCYGKYFEKEAKKYAFPILNMDNNFDAQLLKAMDMLRK